MRFERAYFECHPCGSGCFVLDERFGVQGLLSVGARRLVCLAGASWSFDAAARSLKKLCGVAVSDSTIRQVCREQGAQMRQWR